MLWWLGAALFLWLALREVYYGFVPKPGFAEPQKIFGPYLVVTLALACA